MKLGFVSAILADQNLDDLRTAMRMLEAAPQDRDAKKRWYRRKP